MPTARRNHRSPLAIHDKFIRNYFFAISLHGTINPLNIKALLALGQYKKICHYQSLLQAVLLYGFQPTTNINHPFFLHCRSSFNPHINSRTKKYSLYRTHISQAEKNLNSNTVPPVRLVLIAKGTMRTYVPARHGNDINFQLPFSRSNTSYFPMVNNRTRNNKNKCLLFLYCTSACGI